jgi:hypothetical protein
VALLGLQFLWLAQTSTSPTLSSVGDYVDWILLGVVAALSAWIALFHTACSHRENSRLVGYLLLGEATVCLAAAASRARVGGSVVAWHEFRSAMLIAAPATAGLLVLLALAHLAGRPRPEPTVNDEHLFFFGPSGVAPSRGPSEGTSPGAGEGASAPTSEDEQRATEGASARTSHSSSGVAEGTSAGATEQSTAASQGSSGASEGAPANATESSSGASEVPSPGATEGASAGASDDGSANT